MGPKTGDATALRNGRRQVLDAWIGTQRLYRTDTVAQLALTHSTVIRLHTEVVLGGATDGTAPY